VIKFYYPNTVLLVSAILLVTSCSLNSSNEELKLGAKYEIIRSVYLEGVYDSLNNRKLSRETARAYINAVKYANRSEVAFQVKIPAGTIMTIVSSVKKVWHIPYIVDQYSVKITPDLSRGLDVVLSVDRGLEGDLDGLNPQVFRRK